MMYAFICDDTQTYKGFNAEYYEDGIDFAFAMLGDAKEVRIVPFDSIPDGYAEA